MIEGAKKRARSAWDWLQGVPDRLRIFLTRPWAARKLVWAHRRKLLKDFRTFHALLGRYEEEIRVFTQAAEVFPGLVRRSAYARPVRMGYGPLSIEGPILSLNIEEGFHEVRPLLDWLVDQGYHLQKYDDKGRSLRRYRLRREDETGGTRGYVMAHVSSTAKCDVIERKVETTEYEIVCEGEAEIRRTS